MSNIHTGLATSQDEDILSDPELSLLLELRRMNNCWNIFKTLNIGNVGSDMQARADCYSITMPRRLLSSVRVIDDMATFLRAFNFDNRSIQVDVRLELELLAVSFQVVAVGFSGQEVWRVEGAAIVRESCKLSRRDELYHSQLPLKFFQGVKVRDSLWNLPQHPHRRDT